MSELEIYYSKEQLEHIDQLIETQVDKQLDQQIQDCLLAQIQPLFGQVDYSLFRNLSQRAQSMAEELVICEMFCILSSQHSKVVSQLNAHIDSKDGLIADLQSKQKVLRQELCMFQAHKQQLQKAVMYCNKNITELSHKLLIQNDKILNQQTEIIELKSLLSDKDNSINREQHEKQSIAASLSIQVDRLQNQLQVVLNEKNSLNEFIQHLQEDLNQEIERRTMNLVTFTIQSEEIALKHREALDMFQKAQTIYTQNRRIVTLLSQISSRLTNYELVDFQLPLQQIETSLQAMCEEIIRQQSKISKLHDICDANISAQIGTNRQLVCQLKEGKLIMKQYQEREDNQRKQQQQLKQKISMLQKTMHHLTESNYKILLDLQQNKSKIEQSYFRECQLTKSLGQELDLMKELVHASKTKIQALEIRIKEEIELNREMERKNSQALIKYQQLQQIYSILKQSISQKLDSYKAEESSQFQLLEHLIDKNENLSQQLAAARAKLNSVDYERQLDCELKEKMTKQLIEKMETVDYTINTNKILKEENERYEAALKQTQTQQYVLKMRLIQQQQIIANLNNQLKTIPVTAQKTEKQAQTQNMMSVRQSQIRRQKVSPNLTTSQLSLIQISDEQQLKQNTLSSLNRTSNHHKFKYKNSEPNRPNSCNHLQKIGALNEIINYFMNYIKGYTGRSVRPNSWLANQIFKYGQEYQLKLMEEGNMQTKVKNMKMIEEICRKEKPCSRLIQQFESVMDYYFEERSAVLRQKSLNGTISKSRCTRTVNKCVPNDKTVIFRVQNGAE